jgi:hypothetical protein
MGTVTFLAPANPQWVGLELKMMGVLRRLLGNESLLAGAISSPRQSRAVLARNSAIISGRSSV